MLLESPYLFKLNGLMHRAVASGWPSDTLVLPSPMTHLYAGLRLIRRTEIGASAICLSPAACPE